MKLKNKKTNKWKITKEFIIKEYIKNKKSMLQISKEAKIPYETLYWYKQKFKLPTHDVSILLKGKRNSPKTEFKKGHTPWNTGTKGLVTPWNKGKKLSEEYKQKVRIATKKAMQNPQVRKRISERTKQAMKNPLIMDKIKKTQFKKETSPWNKNRKTGLKPREGIKHTETTKKKISKKLKEALARPEIKALIQKTQFKKGINPWNKGKTDVYSKETIETIRNARLKQIFPKKSTNPELILFDILKELNITFKKHAAIKNICQADAFIKPNLIIFADGDYWHCNPSSFKEPKTLAQKKNLERDTKANEKLLKEGYHILRLWENDLLKHRQNCKDRIITFVIDGG